MLWSYLKERLFDLKNIISPFRCPLCRLNLWNQQSSLCSSCWGKLIFINKNYCRQCGKFLSQEHGLMEHDVNDAYLNSIMVCASCHLAPFELDFHRSVFQYKPDTIGKLIQGFKHRNQYWLNDLLGDFMTKHIHLPNKILKEKCVLMPVPLHWTRLIDRGFNQSGILAAKLSKNWNIPVVSWLYRRRKTEFQRDKTILERQSNVNGAFDVHESVKSLVSDTHVILVDDVFTTGSTLFSCAQILRKYNAKMVGAVTLAKV